jgi:hypothetical protein
MFTSKTVRQIDPSKVVKTYSGKANRCCCGCCGTYEYDARSPQSLRVILALNHALATDDPALDLDHGEYAAIEIGKRLYVAYFV